MGKTLTPLVHNTYVSVEPISKLPNNNARVSFVSTKHTRTSLKKMYVPFVGDVYLAPREKTVLLPEKAIKMAKIRGIKVNEILNLCNEQ